MEAPSSQTETFLTEAQRAALDAALAAKSKIKGPPASVPSDLNSGRKHGKHVKPAHGTAGDRKSKQAKDGAAKKGGGGGKFTWGNAFSDQSTPAMDKGDPNYDSDADAVVREVQIEDEMEDGDYEPAMQSRSRIVQAVMEYKDEIMHILREYLESGDMEEAAICIGELQLPQYDYYIVKRAITLSMDRKDREKEAICVLLSNLYGQFISPQQMQKGFVAVLEGLDDLILDVPDAVEIMSLFICRAISDDILPPSFIGRLIPPPGSPLEDLQHKCQAQSTDRHSAERLSRCWGADASLDFDAAREKIKAMLDEYVAAGDVGEVERQLRSMNTPFLHHEVVKQVILMCAQVDNDVEARMVDLLAKLTERSEISSLQMYKGFQRVVDQLDDLVLDNPSIHENFHRVYEDCVAKGIIDKADQRVLEEAEKQHSVDAESSAAVHVHSVGAYKADIASMLQEYFDSMDVDEICQCLSEQGDEGMHHIFVKQAIQLAMGRTFRERELISCLFVALVPNIIGEEQLHMGLKRLLMDCDDLVLDEPDAVHLMALFLARMVVDEVLPPVFLSTVLDLMKSDSLGVVVIRQTVNLLTSRHAGERILNCWHGGLQTVEQINTQMRLAIKEYTLADDVHEAVTSLHELNMPYYHHEFVRLSLEAAFEQPAQLGHLLKLLHHLAQSGEVNQTQLEKGITKVQSRLDDYSLDCPSAKTITDDFIKQGKAEGWLELAA